MRKIFTALPLLVLCSCNNNKEVSIVDSFKTTELLRHKVFDVQNGSEDLLNPFSIAVSGNTITACNPQAPYVFTTIDITTKRVIKHWGTIGQGPNEFFGPIDLYNNYSESGLNVLAGLLGKLSFFSHSNLESDSAYFQTILTDLKWGEDGYYETHSAMQIDSSMFFVTGGKNKRFSVIDLKNNEIKEARDFPSENMNTQPPVVVRNKAYNGRIRYNSSLKNLFT